VNETTALTDSIVAALYRVALGPRGEPSEDSDETVLLANFGVTGACMGPPPVPPVKANGIAATQSGKYLIVGHLKGQHYRIDTATHAVSSCHGSHSPGTQDVVIGGATASPVTWR
jgi:hypothetical protein